MTNSKTIKAGETLTFEHGEYSDFGYDGPYVVLKDFDTATVVQEFRAQEKKPDVYYIHGFIHYLARMGYIEAQATAHTWYLGGYEFRPDFV